MADDIETVCKRMVADANAQFEKYEKEQSKDGVKKPNVIRLFLSEYDKSKSRTPEQQADEVLAGRSWTCNSSHMADAARHVGPKLNGKGFGEVRAFKKGLSDDEYDKFVEIYASAMKKQGLMNYKGAAGFLPDSADPLHMELKDSRLPESDPRIQKCQLVYATATREDGKKRNDEFEKNNKKFLDDYDKKNPAKTEKAAP